MESQQPAESVKIQAYSSSALAELLLKLVLDILVRTIVDGNKNIHRFNYHPHGDLIKFERACEIRPKSSRRR